MNKRYLKFKCCLFSTLLLMGMASIVTAAGSGGGGGVSGLPSTNVPSFDPAEKYDEGVKFLQAEEYKKATKSFKKVLTVVKKHGPANYFLGLSYIGLEKYKKAKKPLEKAIKYEPKLISARGYLGMIYLKIKKPEKAQMQRTELIKLQTHCGECENKKKILDALNRIDSSEKISVLQNKSDHTLGDLLYVQAVAFINQGDYTAALDKLQQASMVFGPHPDILTYQGFANRKLGKLDQSIYYYKMALTIAPDHKGANEYLGEYYVLKGDMQQARNQLAKLDKICEFSCEEYQELQRWIIKATP
jgi:tetratricopeptide (TPR) repeat protein